MKPTTQTGDRHNQQDEFIGFVVHKETVVIAAADGGRPGDVRYEDAIYLQSLQRHTPVLHQLALATQLPGEPSQEN